MTTHASTLTLKAQILCFINCSYSQFVLYESVYKSQFEFFHTILVICLLPAQQKLNTGNKELYGKIQIATMHFRMWLHASNFSPITLKFSIITFYSAGRGSSLGFETGVFSFFSCRDLVIIDFFGNLRRAIKLVLNSPTRLSTVVSVGLLRMRYESKFLKKYC